MQTINNLFFPGGNEMKRYMLFFLIIGIVMAAPNANAVQMPIAYAYDVTMYGYNIETEEYTELSGKAHIYWQDLQYAWGSAEFVASVSGVIDCADLGFAGDVFMEGTDIEMTINDFDMFFMGSGSPYHIDYLNDILEGYGNGCLYAPDFSWQNYFDNAGARPKGRPPAISLAGDIHLFATDILFNHATQVPVPVPEPSTLFLLGTVLTGIGSMGSKSRKK